MNIDDLQPEVCGVESDSRSPRCCFRCCLPGEYLALGLITHAGLGAAAWAVSVWQVPAGMIAVTAAVWIVGRSAGAFSGRWFAPLVTVGVALAVSTLWQANLALPHVAQIMFSPSIFLAMLAVILAADLIELVPSMLLVSVRTSLRRLNWYRVAVWALGLAFVAYMVVVPTASWIIERMYPPESGRELIEMSLAEQVRINSMKAVTAFLFFVFGGTIGSFLNVVAYRLPRGESVVFQRSRCPKCGTEILGRDNMPIFGWLLLGGRCRACRTPISARYPIVESITAALFLVLYFVELISGGANIPNRMPNLYRGVVWIIFYTKWDLVGLYLYHCFAMSVLLTYTLIDIDRQRVTARARWIVVAALFIPPLISPHLLPVPVFADAASWLTTPWLRTGVSCLAGGLLGAVLGWLTVWGVEPPLASAEHSSRRSQFATSLPIVGISLGWQAAIVVLLLTLLFQVVTTLAAQWRRWPRPHLTTVLLAAFVVHQTAWRWTVHNGGAWWPSDRTSAGGWIAAAVAYAALLPANRLLARRREDAG